MYDVFLSYSGEDRARVKVIADALSTCGWTVWWDRAIPPGQTFDDVIEEALDHTRSVVVLWSKTSVASHWVKAEASEGARRQMLVPVLLDEVRIPLEFRRVHAADLTAWNGEQGHAEFERLVQAVSTLAPVVPAENAQPQDVSEHRLQALNASRRRNQWLTAALVVSVLAAAIVSALGIWSLRLRQRTLADALAVSAERTQETDPLGSLVKAIAAAETAQTAQTRHALERALQHRYPRAILRHNSTVIDASFSPDDQSVVTASYDSTARVWDGQTGRSIGRELTHANRVATARFSPDNRLVVTASFDKTARVWDARRGELIKALEGHSGPLVIAKFSGDGRALVTASLDGTALLWNAQTLQIAAELRGHSGPIAWVGFAPDSRSLLTFSLDGTGRMWRVETGGLLMLLEGSTGPVVDAAFSHDGRFITTASSDATARRWEIPPETDSRDGRRLPSAQAASLAFRKASPVSVRPLQLQSDTIGKIEGRLSISSLSFSPNGQWILGTTDGGPALLWDASTGKTARTFAPPEVPGSRSGGITSAALSPDGNSIAGAGRDGTVVIWNRETGSEIGVFRFHTGAVRRIVFNSSGRDLVTASDDGTAAVWKSQTPSTNPSSSFADLLRAAQASVPLTLATEDRQRLAR